MGFGGSVPASKWEQQRTSHKILNFSWPRTTSHCNPHQKSSTNYWTPNMSHQSKQSILSEAKQGEHVILDNSCIPTNPTQFRQWHHSKRRKEKDSLLCNSLFNDVLHSQAEVETKAIKYLLKNQVPFKNTYLIFTCWSISIYTYVYIKLVSELNQ